MSILKMRDENGTIHSIAIMKGDKGDGVPDGGTTGQVIKKTADGTEWGDTGVPDGGSAGQVLKKTESGTAWGDVDISSKCEVLFTNTNTNIDSYTIEKRGLYDVKLFFAQNNYLAFPPKESYSRWERILISVSDLSENQWQGHPVLWYMDNGQPKSRSAGVQYNVGKKLTATYRHVIVNDDGTIQDVGHNRAYLAEVKLIIPYE
jgi:hypothetical protein